MDTLTPEDVERASGGRYRVESVVGRGGMGTVYLAVNRELGSRVAIKVLNADIVSNAARIARFRREAALSAQLSHPNIVPVFELQVVDEMAYLVMPFIEGVSLEERLRTTGPLPAGDVKQLVQQIGDALSYAHSRGVIHRDVKPANILLERESGRWMLTDFGVAHISVEGVTQLTATDATIGTLSYMAPEQLGGAREVDERADLYSLALVACEALLGMHPERDGPQDTARKLHENVSGLDSEWVKTLVWPLAAARDERPPNIPTWLARLKTPRRRVRRRMAIVAGSIAVGTVAIWGFQQRDGAPARPNQIVAVFPIESNDAAFPDLGSVLTLGLTRQIQTLPGIEALSEEAVRTALLGRYGPGPYERNDLLQLATSLGAQEAALGTATVSAGSLIVRVEVFDARTERQLDNADVMGVLDSIHVIVSDAVIRAFAARIAEERTGIPTPALPRGIPAVAAYFRGDLALRRGTLEDAVTHFDRVIEADSSFAPAYLKRALALTYQSRPTEAGNQIRPAVDLANNNADRLDVVSQRLLEAISTIIYYGDLQMADRQLRNILGDHPNAVDVRFLLGALQARFPALMNARLEEARNTLNEVLRRDPSYGLAHAVLIQVNALLDNAAATRAAIRGYLTSDSTSPRAAAARFADTLLFRTDQAFRATASFPSRPPLVLENIAQAAGVFRPPAGTRPVAIGAIEALLNNATTNAERAVAARMRLAAYLGSGEFEEARQFVMQAPRMGVPPAEVDRWILLSAVTNVPDLGDESTIRNAVTNLRTTRDDPVTSRWLVARWSLLHDRASYGEARRALQMTAAEAAPDTIEARAFRLDLDALEIAPADAAGALQLWQDATSRYALARIPFGLVSSWWPMHLERVRIAAARDDLSTTRQLVDHFRLYLTGFSDQMGWFFAATTLADVAEQAGDYATAREALDGLLRNFPNRRTPLRDSLQARLSGIP